ncbi:MAG: hypothetical protein IJ368_02725 [Oscillospiraceae bacterium]|nr:hypothetical protein [Oscillospiraceae bacterium]
MKKFKLLKRALAATVSAALAMSIVAVPNVSAGTTIYNKTCSVENIFSDFQYFVNGDADISQHQVGSVYVGGTAKIGSFGDGAIQDSYVRNLESIISTNFGAYLPDDMKKYKSELLYVGNTQAELEANWAIPSWMYLYDPKYIKPTTDTYVEANAFGGLITQSQSMADAAVSSNVSVNTSSNVITIDLTTNKSATVKASDIKSDTTVMLKGISKAADFGTSQYTISVIGIGASTFNLNSKNVVYYDTTAASNVNISDGLRAYAIESGDVQILKKGSMKLIWNMPDATGTITCGALAGHLLAPRAYVDVDSGGAYAGHHEGGIIAASVKAAQSQGHFYPYNPLGTSLPNPTVEKPGDIELIKTYTVDGSAVNNITEDQLTATVFQIAELDATGNETGVYFTACPYVLRNAANNIIGYQVVFSGSSIKENTYYRISEKSSPDGFTKSNAVFYAHVFSAASGKVLYSTEFNGSYTDAVPVFENTKTVVKCSFDFKKTDGKSALAGAEFSLYFGSTLIAKAVSDASGKVSFANIPEGTYTLRETKTPDGFEENTAVYTVNVTADSVIITAPAGDTSLSGTAGSYSIKNTAKTTTTAPDDTDDDTTTTTTAPDDTDDDTTTTTTAPDDTDNDTTTTTTVPDDTDDDTTTTTKAPNETTGGIGVVTTTVPQSSDSDNTNTTTSPRETSGGIGLVTTTVPQSGDSDNTNTTTSPRETSGGIGVATTTVSQTGDSDNTASVTTTDDTDGSVWTTTASEYVTTATSKNPTIVGTGYSGTAYTPAVDSDLTYFFPVIPDDDRDEEDDEEDVGAGAGLTEDANHSASSDSAPIVAVVIALTACVSAVIISRKSRQK